MWLHASSGWWTQPLPVIGTVQAKSHVTDIRQLNLALAAELELRGPSWRREGQAHLAHKPSGSRLQGCCRLRGVEADA